MSPLFPYARASHTHTHPQPKPHAQLLSRLVFLGSNEAGDLAVQQFHGAVPSLRALCVFTLRRRNSDRTLPTAAWGTAFPRAASRAGRTGPGGGASDGLSAAMPHAALPPPPSLARRLLPGSSPPDSSHASLEEVPA